MNDDSILDSIPGIKEISHIALMVLNLDTAVAQFKAFGFSLMSDSAVDAEEHGTKVMVVEKGETVIELIEPVTDDKIAFYQDRIKKYGYYMDHICYCCDNIEDTVKILKQYRFIPSTPICRSPVWNNRRTIFLVNRKMGVIELLES